MQTATNAAQWLVRLTGVTQVVMGLLFWTGRALHLVPVHMAVGLTFVLGLWALAGLAARAGAGLRLVTFAALWGALVLGLGITQRSVLPGPAHWVVEVLHLVVGFAAMALAAQLAARIRAREGDAGSSGSYDSTHPGLAGA
jgi:hypothetical protein